MNLGRKTRRSLRAAIKYMLLTLIAAAILMPLIFMATHSLMSSAEIQQTNGPSDHGGYATLTLIPEKVSLEQYYHVFFRSPKYLTEFWNSVLLTFPTVLLQTVIAFLAAYRSPS